MLIDNKNNGKVVAELKKRITSNSKLSILSGLFSIYGFSCLKNELSQIPEVRMMLSRFDDESIPLLSGSISELRLKNQLDQQAVAKECTKWLSSNISIKALNKNLVNQNLFHLKKSDGDSFAIHGSSNFTA